MTIADGKLKENCLHLRSPAKINLFLKVTGKRTDGYHLLFSLMAQVGLFDHIYITPSLPSSSIICHHPKVPEDETNLALKAAMVFLRALSKCTTHTLGGVAIQLDKNIPVGAGLGGGSSNAATVLLGLNQYFGHPFTMKNLLNMGLKLGSDVPFFIYNQPALVTGIGETLEPYRRLDPFKVLLVYPGYDISTALVYKNLNLRLTKCKKKISYSSFKNKKFCPNQHLCNDLESVTIALKPELHEIKALLIKLGACGALMSGSGSSIFGLFNDNEIAQEAYNTLSQNRKWQINLADLML